MVQRIAGRCVCIVEQEPGLEAVAVGGAAVATPEQPRMAVVINYESACAGAPGVTTSAAANALHWLTCGLISFARGWNDTPKIAALSLFALAAMPHGTAVGFAIVTVAMAVGGLLAGRRVLDTLARKLTPLPLAESLTASLTTAALVIVASKVALPVSTTHVATGSIIGAGLKNDPGNIKWGKVGEVVLSWVVTLPVAGLIAAAAKFVIR
jgi:PiT family inorganic phosphate transporter